MMLLCGPGRRTCRHKVQGTLISGGDHASSKSCDMAYLTHEVAVDCADHPSRVLIIHSGLWQQRLRCRV